MDKQIVQDASWQPGQAWRGLALYLAGAWFTVQLYFLFGATLIIFTSFDPTQAGGIVRVLFPAYFVANFVCGGGYLLAVCFGRRSLAYPFLNVTLAILAILCIAIIAAYIRPMIQQIRDAGGEAAGWHRLSMWLNLVAMISTFLAGITLRRHRSG